MTFRKHFLERCHHIFLLHQGPSGKERTKENHVCNLFLLQLHGLINPRDREQFNIRPRREADHRRFFVHKEPARLDCFFEFLERRLVENDRRIKGRYNGGTDPARRNNDDAVGRSSPHFGTVRGHPAHLFSLDHRRVGNDLAHGKNSLPAESGNNDLVCLHTSIPLSVC